MDKSSKGFIKLDRSIFNHWIFQDAEKFKAFVDLIQLARWKEEKLIIGNEIVVVPRGSYYTSELKLAEKWGWSRHKTRDFLKLLESEQMITKKGTPKGTTLTIVNYSFYQDEGTTKNTTKGQQKDIIGPARGQQKDIIGYTKEEIKEREEIKEGEEREEEIPKLPPLSFPTPIHEKIFSIVKEVGYRTWFMDSVIEDKGNKIVITEKAEFKRNIIRDKYIDKLTLALGKEVEIK